MNVKPDFSKGKNYAETAPAFLSVWDMQSYYGESYIVQNISFNVHEGEIVALVTMSSRDKCVRRPALALAPSPSRASHLLAHPLSRTTSTVVILCRFVYKHLVGKCLPAGMDPLAAFKRCRLMRTRNCHFESVAETSFVLIETLVTFLIYDISKDAHAPYASAEGVGVAAAAPAAERRSSSAR